MHLYAVISGDNNKEATKSQYFSASVSENECIDYLMVKRWMSILQVRSNVIQKIGKNILYKVSDTGKMSY